MGWREQLDLNYDGNGVYWLMLITCLATTALWWLW